MAEIQVRSVKKALDALDYIAKVCIEEDGATLSAIAAELDEKLPTLRNILKTMESCGYLSRCGKLYRPGAKHSDLARSGVIKRLIEVTNPLLQNAAESTGESMVFATMINGRREVLRRYQGSSKIGVIIDVADDDRIYKLETTRIMLAFADKSERQQFFTMNGFPDASWPEAAGGNLEKCLNQLREVGFASSGGGNLSAYAVPLLNSSGLLLGSIGAYAPAFRNDSRHEEKLLQTLQKIAAKVKEQF